MTFFQNLNQFFRTVSPIFHDQAYFFTSSVGKVNMSLTILVLFECKRFTKKLLMTSLMTYFQQPRVLKTYLIIYKEFTLSIKALNLNNCLEIRWHHQKSHVIMITILPFLKDLTQCYAYRKFNSQGLTDSGFMEREEGISPTPRLFTVKKVQAGQVYYH